MPDWPLENSRYNQVVISSASPESVGLMQRTIASTFAATTAWPTANLAIFVPVEIYKPVTIVQMAINNGATVGGNVDVGIYWPDGTKVVSSGSTAHSGASAIQIFDITDTPLTPGLYYMALAFDNNTSITSLWVHAQTHSIRGMGVVAMASAFPLPAPATFAALPNPYVPLIVMTSQTVL